MSVATVKMISDSLQSLGINYEFGERKSRVQYPYFVGEYQESPPLNEDGLQETTFILTGFTRGSWLALEEAKENIANHFDKVSGQTAITEAGSAVAIFYESSLIIPTEDAELKKIQINLKIMEWSV